MYCSDCGQELAAGALRCAKCGTPTVASEVRARARDDLERGSKDAVAYLKTLFSRPGAGAAEAATELDGRRAMVAGGLLAPGVAIGLGLGFSVLGDLLRSLGIRDIGWMQLLLAGLLPTITLTALRAASRRLFGQGGSAAIDLLTSAGALVPMGVAGLAARLLGSGNVEIVAILASVALVLLVISVYESDRITAGIESHAAPLITAGELLLSAWLMKVVVVAIW